MKVEATDVYHVFKLSPVIICTYFLVTFKLVTVKYNASPKVRTLTVIGFHQIIPLSINTFDDIGD